MSEHPLDVLRVAIKFAKQNRLPPHREDAALRAVEQLEQAARECRDSMRAERVDVLMANGPIFLDMLDEGLALFDRKETCRLPVCVGFPDQSCATLLRRMGATDWRVGRNCGHHCPHRTPA